MLMTIKLSPKAILRRGVFFPITVFQISARVIYSPMERDFKHAFKKSVS